MSLSVAAVAIGRNEGERLKRCLDTLIPQAGRVVYVDSGSSDGSVEYARAAGAEVVILDTSTPFTAARARNAGFEALRRSGLPDLVQFVDGDCGVEPGWIDAARAALEADPELGIVTGWRSEINRDASVYNQMCEIEWHRPAGSIWSCGGDMMVRAVTFDQIGGFNPTIIASEDEELCLRARKTGKTLVRLPLAMTLHDAAMTRFSEWWKRSVRSGHGFAEVGGLHPPHFKAERRRVLIFGLILPATIAALLAVGEPWWAAAVAIWYPVSWYRTARGLTRSGQPWSEAARHAVFMVIGKFANLKGMAIYYLRRLRGLEMRIIEYK